MGTDQSKSSKDSKVLNNIIQQKHFKNQGQMLQTFECKYDTQCQNINSKMSEPGKPPVLVCPSAKCIGGSCECGSECKKDPYMGFCCKDVEIIKSINGQGSESINTFCIENLSDVFDSRELFGPF